MSKYLETRVPQVSVIIPFYNRISLVVESIQSVLNQTFQDFEIILIDDGSTENTGSVLQLAKKDNRIKLLSGEHKGVSEARNLALKHVRGEYIAFLDSDDLFLPEKLAVQLEYMKKNNLSFSHTSYEKIDVNCCSCGIVHSGTFRGKVYPSIIGGCPLATPTIMVRSEVFLENDIKFKSGFHLGEDVCLWIDIASRYTFGGLDIPLSKVRVSAGSAAYDPDKQLIGLNNIYNYCKSDDNHKVYSEQFYRLEVLMRDCRKQQDMREDFEKKYKALSAKHARLTEEFEKAGFMPLVSIVIPVYNGANYLREAIESALLQTYPNTEVLVVNDGSKDGGATEGIAKSYGSRVRYICKENGGVASALNDGIRNMKGEYFSWLSHDDLYTEDKIESQVRLLTGETDKKRIICGGYALFRGKDQEVFGTMDPFPVYEKKLSIPLYPVFRGLLNGCTMLIHRSHFERVGLFDESLPTTQDYDLWFRMLRQQSVLFQKDIHMKSRCHGEQGSRTLAHKNEAAQLWCNMMDAVNEDECIQMEGGVYEFYKNLFEFLKENLPGNVHAWGYAKHKAIGEVLKSIQEGNIEKKRIQELLSNAYSEEIGMLIYGSALLCNTEKRIAFVVYGDSLDGEYRSFIDRINQFQPGIRCYYINVTQDGEKMSGNKNGISIPVSMIGIDTIPALLSFLNIDCAFAFLHSEECFAPYYNLSTCGNRYVLIYNSECELGKQVSYNSIDDAWAIVSVNQDMEFLDGGVLPNHFTNTYEFECNISSFIEDAVNGQKAIQDTASYKLLNAKKEQVDSQKLQLLLDMALLGISTSVDMANVAQDQREIDLKQSTVTINETTSGLSDSELVHIMENTISWRITKPLRLARQVQRTLQAEGIKMTVRKIARRLIR